MNCYQPADRTQPRMLRGRHDTECPASATESATGTTNSPSVGVNDTDVVSGAQIGAQCRGCQPCTKSHCDVLWIAEEDCQIHAVSVCPKCLGATREHLSEIRRLSALPLLEEALSRGTRSEAADMLGPVADPNQWRQRGRHGHKYEPDSRLGDMEPYTMLGRYDLIVTEHLGHRRTGRITIASAGDYLDRNLSYLAADLEFDFAEMAQSFRDCRGHLEAVLHDGEQVERGAPCIKCGTAITKTTEGGVTRFECKRCHRELTENEYRNATKAAHLVHADRLSIPDLSARLKVPESTLRSWASVMRVQRKGEAPVEHPPLLRSCGRDGLGRKVYHVVDAEVIRESGDRRRSSGTVSGEGAA